jgi:maltose alpha-D-glucosyltransferase/alpha-amylase
MINDLWYKNAVIYCLSVGTYMDSSGDGIGDFKGLMRRLDYLHGLGATAIWLMPFQVSPHRDDGYDVSDYYGVDPRYGTIGDFVEFTHGAKQRGIRHLSERGAPAVRESIRPALAIVRDKSANEGGLIKSRQTVSVV